MLSSMLSDCSTGSLVDDLYGCAMTKAAIRHLWQEGIEIAVLRTMLRIYAPSSSGHRMKGPMRAAISPGTFMGPCDLEAHD